MTRTTAEILRAARETLATAEQGLRDVEGRDPARRRSGLHNLVVFGRAVTNILQHLRSTEPDFDPWYAPHVEEMKGDPLLRYFYDLRSSILKEGPAQIGVGVHIHHFNFPDDLQRLGPPPPNAKGFFMGDSLGGSGWEVALPDAGTARYYVDLPPEIVTTSLHLPDAPRTHLGKPLDNKDAAALSRLYVAYLDRLLRAAEERFRSP